MVNFFNDCWLQNGRRLIDSCTRSLSFEEASSSVADWIGAWDFSKIAGCVNQSAVQEIASVLPPRPEAGLDFLVWGASHDGIFSVKSAYFLIEDNPQHLHSPIFKKIWNWKGVECIRVFLMESGFE